MRSTLAIGSALAASSSFLLGSAVFAGPSLNAIQSIVISGTTDIETSYGESFSVTGNTGGSGGTTTYTPFAVTDGLASDEINPAFNGGDPTDTSVNPIISAASPSNVGAVGTAVLTTTYDKDGKDLLGQEGDGQINSTSGLIQLGGSGTVGGTNAFNTPSQVILNQSSTNGLGSITLAGSTTDDGVIGASITGTSVGPTDLTAGLTIQKQVINSLSVFNAN